METSQTIEKWGREIFGEAELDALALRAKEELEELIAAIKAGESHADIVAEAADVTILLHRLTGTLNMELSKAVEAKMVINREREWIRSGDGTGQHK